MFYLIGLGLGDCKDITVKGLEIVKKCDKVYLENYTSVLTCGVEALENFYGRKLILADRTLVEEDADEILSGADTSDVALLVVGDPFGATTHIDILLRAKENGIEYAVVHNASIMNAVGCCGLQLYGFGETVSIPLWTESWKPDSFFDKILLNYKQSMHTLCLLDIKVKEPTPESLVKKVREYMPPTFMSVSDAAKQLLEICKNKPEASELWNEKLCVGLARVGSPSQKIVVASLEKMAEIDLGTPLHSLVIPSSDMHPVEFIFLNQFRVDE